MQITMNDANVESIAQLREIIKLTKQVEFQSLPKDKMYRWMSETLTRFKYHKRVTPQKDRGIIITYSCQMTGLSRSHAKCLCRRKKKENYANGNSIEKVEPLSLPSDSAQMRPPLWASISWRAT